MFAPCAHAFAKIFCLPLPSSASNFYWFHTTKMQQRTTNNTNDNKGLQPRLKPESLKPTLDTIPLVKSQHFIQQIHSKRPRRSCVTGTHHRPIGFNGRLEADFRHPDESVATAREASHHFCVSPHQPLMIPHVHVESTIEIVQHKYVISDFIWFHYLRIVSVSSPSDHCQSRFPISSFLQCTDCGGVGDPWLTMDQLLQNTDYGCCN